MSMLSPQILFLAPAIMAVGALAGMQWMQRHTALLRLRTALGGVSDPGAQYGLSRLLQRIGSRIPGASDESLRAELIRAGYFQPSALHVFVAFRLICTGAVFFAVLLHAPSVQASTLMLAVFLAFLSSRLFVIALKLKAEKREREVRRELPPFVDVLLMILNSGVSIDQCLHYVTNMLERTAPLTNAVLKRYIADVDSGMPYETAFERMGQRLGINEGYDLVNLIKQALLQGGEIMGLLENFGADLADKRVATAREQIGRKSVYLTLAMLVFFMPVLMITLGGPAVSHLTETLKVVKHDLHGRRLRQ